MKWILVGQGPTALAAGADGQYAASDQGLHYLYITIGYLHIINGYFHMANGYYGYLHIMGIAHKKIKNDENQVTRYLLTGRWSHPICKDRTQGVLSAKKQTTKYRKKC